MTTKPESSVVSEQAQTKRVCGRCDGSGIDPVQLESAPAAVKEVSQPSDVVITTYPSVEDTGRYEEALFRYADRIEKGMPYLRNSTTDKFCKDIIEDMRTEAIASIRNAQGSLGEALEEQKRRDVVSTTRADAIEKALRDLMSTIGKHVDVGRSPHPIEPVMSDARAALAMPAAPSPAPEVPVTPRHSLCGQLGGEPRDASDSHRLAAVSGSAHSPAAVVVTDEMAERACKSLLSKWPSFYSSEKDMRITDMRAALIAALTPTKESSNG